MIFSFNQLNILMIFLLNVTVNIPNSVKREFNVTFKLKFTKVVTVYIF